MDQKQNYIVTGVNFMAEITTTQAFSDGDTVTATKLNNITGNASLQTEAITNRSAETTVDQANDLLLMYDASATALKKVTLSNVIKAGTASNFPVTGNATIGGTLGVTGVVSAASTIELGHASDTTLARGAAGRLTVEGVNVPTISSTDTLTNKTLTSPVISTISNTGTLTLPTSTDTLVGRATTDTLTNKTLTSPSLTSPSITSGVLTTQAGSVSAPAISPTGDTNTGLFFPAADTIAASTGGTEAMRIDSSGNVLLGQNRITSDSSITSLGIYGGLVSGSTTSQINFYGKSVSNTGLTYNIARITGIASDPNYSLAGGLQFSTASNDGVNNLTLTERLRIDS
ncbi:MAG: hypothetical protein EBS53_17410, partial [Bacteroidetes bacterium]|nr:hypothetical protein [Bacteroidota bacterium]